MIGIPASRIISICLIIITIAALYLVWHSFINDKITLIYLSVAVVIPMLFVIFRIVRSRGRKELHTASGIIKLIMIAGVLYSVVVKAIISWNLL